MLLVSCRSDGGAARVLDSPTPSKIAVVASEQAIKVAALGMYYTPWTLERSNGAFATGGNLAQSAQPAGTIGVASGNANQFSASVGGYYLNHAGVSGAPASRLFTHFFIYRRSSSARLSPRVAAALDYEDMLFMMYALKWDVPNSAHRGSVAPHEALTDSLFFVSQ